MTPGRFLLIACTAFLFWPSSARAQAKDQFVQGLVEFITAVDGTKGDEGPALLAAIDTMAEGLARWDAAVKRVETGLASEIGKAPPQAAAKMRGTLGTVYLERGRFDAALAQFDMASALDPSLADVQVLRGLALELLNRPREAADAYRQAWRRDSSSAANAYRVLRTSPSSGSADTAASMKVLLGAVASTTTGGPRFVTFDLLDDQSVEYPVFPLARYSDAFALIRQARYGDAIARLRTSAASDPLVTDAARKSSAEAHRVLGLAHAQASRYDEALAELRTAIGLGPNDERARLALADVLVAKQDPAAARVALAETTKVIPSSGQAHWKLGALHRSFGDEANAVRSFEAAAARVPFAGAGRLQASIGRVYHNQLDLDTAAAAYARRVSLNPNDGAAHLDLADVYRAADKQEAALAEASIAALLDPSSARSFAMVGQILAAMGRDEEAVVTLRRAIAIDASHLEAHYALSRALGRLNRVDEAREEMLIFERLQAKAMADERQRFQDNQRKIQETLKSAPTGDLTR